MHTHTHLLNSMADISVRSPPTGTVLAKTEEPASTTNRAWLAPVVKPSKAPLAT